MQITKDLINNIADEIAQKINDESDLFGHVSSEPATTLEGFPAVIVMISENENLYSSTGGQDSRRLTFVFSLNIYYPATKEEEQVQAERALREAVSELLRIFVVKKPLETCDLGMVSNTPFGETTAGEATFRTAQVILTCTKYVDTQ